MTIRTKHISQVRYIRASINGAALISADARARATLAVAPTIRRRGLARPRIVGAGLAPALHQLLLKSALMAVALLLMLAFMCLAFPLPSAHAASTGRIFGQLLNGTNKNTPLAGQKVTLQMAQGDSAKDLANVTTDAHGAYMFPNLNTDKTISYALYIRYQGAQYSSNIITLDTRPVQQLNLTVYNATTSTANIAVVRATILLRKPDAQKGSISVSELYIFRNLDTRTYVGSLDASHGKPNALRFSLPHTARNVSLGSGFDGYQGVEVNNGIATDAAIPPGDSQFAFTFEMPYTRSTYDFDYKVLYPTVQLTLLLPLEIHGSSSVLASKGPVTSEQTTFNLFQASAVLANQEVHVQLEGLPTVTPATGSSTSAPDPGNPWLIVGILLAMAIILLVTGLIYRLARRPAPGKKKALSQKQAIKASPARQSKVANVSVKPDADKEQELLQELLDLDKAFEAGKMSKSVYQEHRAKTKARLRALMSEKVTS
ncbi:MAG: hypothetical protein ACJ788_19865 [Ktedonobacteraceae bacterium]